MLTHQRGMPGGCWQLPAAAESYPNVVLEGITCSLTSLHHLRGAVSIILQAVSQPYFMPAGLLWISFCGMAAPSLLHLGTIRF